MQRAKKNDRIYRLLVSVHLPIEVCDPWKKIGKILDGAIWRRLCTAILEIRLNRFVAKCLFYLGSLLFVCLVENKLKINQSK